MHVAHLDFDWHRCTAFLFVNADLFLSLPTTLIKSDISYVFGRDDVELPTVRTTRWARSRVTHMYRTPHPRPALCFRKIPPPVT